VWLDRGVPDVESMTRDELIAHARRQDAQITALATQLADVTDRFEQAAEKLAKLEHLISRNSSNSNFPSSKDGGPGGTVPPRRQRRAQPGGRKKGKQPGDPGTALAWSDTADRMDRFPEGPCACGADLADAEDLGIVDRYQQHEIPLVTVSITQYDQHAVACACGQMHTAARPAGAGVGRIEYGPNLRAFVLYLLVVHYVPVHRVREILTTLTGAEPSIGFIHSLISRAARQLHAVDQLIRTLITLAVAVCCDETPLKTGPATPATGKKEAKGYLHAACTELYTHYLLGDRSLETFKQFIYLKMNPDAVIVHDRYTAYDSDQLGAPTHQLCLQHTLRDLATAIELYPDQAWPAQAADCIRELIHRANQARQRGEAHLAPALAKIGTRGLRGAVALGLRHTKDLYDTRPGARKTRLLLEALREREADFPRFTTDLRIPPTSHPGRTRPATSEDPREDLRPTDRHHTHPRAIHHPRRALHRHQTRPERHRRPTRHVLRTPVDAARSRRTRLTTPPREPLTTGHRPSPHARNRRPPITC
jgi:transposase